MGLWQSAEDMIRETVVADTPEHYEVTYPNRDQIWDSLGTFKPTVWAQACESRGNPESKQWDYEAGWDGAMRLWVEGWPEGMQKAGPIVRQIGHAMPSMLSPVQMPSVSPVPLQGPVCDPFALTNGLPCPYVVMVDTEERAERGSKIVRVGMNVTVSCGVHADVMVGRGACVMALVDRLEACGKSVEIDALIGVSSGWNGGGRRFLYRFRLKDAGQSWRPDHLAAMLMHPAGFRRLGFRAMEHTTGDVRGLYHRYGMPMPVKTLVAGQYDVLVDSDTMHNTTMWTTVSGQVGWCLQQLARQGVVVGNG